MRENKPKIKCQYTAINIHESFIPERGYVKKFKVNLKKKSRFINKPNLT